MQTRTELLKSICKYFSVNIYILVFRCNYEQAIVLASYSLQAESGDHDPERHTLENLQDLPLLPKTMMAQLSEERFGKTFKTTGLASTYTWKVNAFFVEKFF